MYTMYMVTGQAKVDRGAWSRLPQKWSCGIIWKFDSSYELGSSSQKPHKQNSADTRFQTIFFGTLTPTNYSLAKGKKFLFH